MKTAGKSVREMAAQRRRRRKWLGYSGIVIVVVAVGLFEAFGTRLALPWAIGCFALFWPLNRYLKSTQDEMDDLYEREGHANRGAEAEELVGAILDSLSKEDHLVLHDVKSPYGNIDHMVLTRGGNVFLIETKAHRGKVAVEKGTLQLNGKPPEKDFIGQSLQNTYWLKERVEEVTAKETWVYPVLVFTNAFVPYFAPVRGVYVINKRFLPETLAKLDRSSGSDLMWPYADLLRKEIQG